MNYLYVSLPIIVITIIATITIIVILLKKKEQFEVIIPELPTIYSPDQKWKQYYEDKIKSEIENQKREYANNIFEKEKTVEFLKTEMKDKLDQIQFIISKKITYANEKKDFENRLNLLKTEIENLRILIQQYDLEKQGLIEELNNCSANIKHGSYYI